MTLISRILGLIRDRVFAEYFGAGPGMDAFFVAFRIPNFLRRLFAEGAFSLAFVPVLSEYKAKRSHADVRELVEHVAGTLFGVLFVVTLIGVAASPFLVMLFAPGFIDEMERFDLTAQMLSITFPYILFVSLVAFAGSVLNAYGGFAAPAFAPVLLNLTLIGAAIWGAPKFEEPVVALAWGVFAGGVVQLLFMLPGLRSLDLLPRLRWGWHHSGVRRILKLMGPAVFGSSVAQINLLFDTLIASFLVAGSVSWLYYSDRLVEFPLGVFGVALATVILPSLSKSHASEDAEGFSATLDHGLRWVVLLSVPAMVGLLLLAGPMLSTLFQYRAFSADDVHMAALSLMAYALGLPGFMLIKVLAPAFYARQDTRTPVRIAVIAMFANMLLNVAIVVPMVMLAVPGPHAGLALATGLSAYLNALLLLHHLRRDGVYRARAGWSGYLWRVAMASALMGAVLWAGPAAWEQWYQLGGWQRALDLAIWVTLGAACYFGLLRLSGLHPAALLRRGGDSGQ